MRVMILGATGLIGSALAARLIARGDEVVAVARGGSVPGARMVRIDLATIREPSQLAPQLSGIDGIVNCAGVLQDSAADSTHVHDRAVELLIEACKRSGIRRLIHLSAVGVDRDTPSEFSRSKLAGDRALIASELDWVILRPSIVIGRGAYGASALMRGLAALPWRPTMGGTGPLQLVHLDDLVDTVLFFLRPDAPSREVLEIVGPRRFSFDEAVDMFRGWMRWPPARIWRLPAGVATLAYKLGDLAALFGWRPPVRTTAQREIGRGAVGDASQWTATTGIEPRDVAAALAAEPAPVQERWFARMYLLKPLIFGVFGAFWLATGIISLTIGWGYGMGLLREGGLEPNFAALTIVAGAVADLLIGAAILYRPTSRYGLYAALAISLTYAVIGTILVPRLWADPLGPMLKIWPVIMLNLVALAIREDR
jgi:uncharacterized protein YbjT (DUF2867 family)